MSVQVDLLATVPAAPVLRHPKGRAVWSLESAGPDVLVLAPGDCRGGLRCAKMSLGGWLAISFSLGALLLFGVLSSLAVLVLVLGLPVYWAMHAFEQGSWLQAIAGAAIELLFVVLLVLAVLAASSGGRWITFDRGRGLLTISQRPFGWRRPPRVVNSRPLAEIAAVQLLYGGIATESLPSGPDAMAPAIERPYDWYEFNLVLHGPQAPRMNLASGPDWTWMRLAGPEIARFLNVPLDDRVYHGPPARSA